MTDVLTRFLKYIKIDTQSNELSDTFPSTDSQINFAHIIENECKAIGLSNISIDNYGYVTAVLESNISYSCPVIAFISHMDTSPDACGNIIKPILTENYNGNDIILSGISISPNEFPDISKYIGDTIISSKGTTLLGADDKAGIAEILSAMMFLKNNPSIKHGKIKIAFTPDEEIGKGADFFDVKNFGADYGYTVDGGALGELEFENFNAAKAVINIFGKSVHPGTAKGIMINASLLASKFISLLPSSDTPEATDGYDGFYHLTSMHGCVSEAKLEYIIRDFDNSNFKKRKERIVALLNEFKAKYKCEASIEITDQYKNMSEIIKNNFEIIEIAKEAMLLCNVQPIIVPIRGGTDGARLSFMGLPCPNIFTGGYNFHGPYEYIPLSSMEKAVMVIAKISELTAIKYK